MYKIWDATRGRFVNEDDVNDYAEYGAFDSPDYYTHSRGNAEMLAADLRRAIGNDFEVVRC